MKSALVLAVVLGLNNSSSLAQSLADQEWSAETVLNELDYPWDIEASANSIIVAEKAGHIVILAGDKVSRFPLETSDPILNEGGGGLLGMALAEDFDTTGRAFFYYTYESGAGRSNKVVAAHFDGVSWRETSVLLDGIPGHRLYNGGRVAIGPDGALYVTTGWTEAPELPQDMTSLAGKTLRMQLDGSIPSDNPFPSSYVYTLGHRNPQGLSWNGAGEMFVSEHGQSATDEINRVTAGGNYGWPLIAGDESADGLATPWLHSGNTTWAPSGITHVGNELLVATLVGRGLYVVNESTGVLAPLFTSDNRLRDVLEVNGAIYVITSNRSPRGEGPSDDSLLRLVSR